MATRSGRPRRSPRDQGDGHRDGRRPSWISWLAGKTEQVRLTVTAPSAKLTSDFVTRHGQEPLRLHFTAPVRTVSYGSLGSRPATHKLPAPAASIAVPESAAAGTIAVAGAARTWERLNPVAVSWFPAGAKRERDRKPLTRQHDQARVRRSRSRSRSPSTRFSGPRIPAMSPSTDGQLAAEQQPLDHVYSERLRLRAGGARQDRAARGRRNSSAVKVSGSDPEGTWSVPAGSTLRLQQLLAKLGYLPGELLPERIGGADDGGPGGGCLEPAEGELRLALSRTRRRRSGTVGRRKLWRAHQGRGDGVRERSKGSRPTGIAGPVVWKALISAALKNQTSSFGYTYVYVTEGSPEQITVWHNGKTVVSRPRQHRDPAGADRTRHLRRLRAPPLRDDERDQPRRVDLSRPGDPWISYFNGGDALHGFTARPTASRRAWGASRCRPPRPARCTRTRRSGRSFRSLEPPARRASAGRISLTAAAYDAGRGLVDRTGRVSGRGGESGHGAITDSCSPAWDRALAALQEDLVRRAVAQDQACLRERRCAARRLGDCARPRARDNRRSRRPALYREPFGTWARRDERRTQARRDQGAAARPDGDLANARTIQPT